jgi:hypothetical protein
MFRNLFLLLFALDPSHWEDCALVRISAPLHASSPPDRRMVPIKALNPTTFVIAPPLLADTILMPT